MYMEPAEEDRLICRDPGIPKDGRNLVMQALVQFRRASGMHTPFRIELDKRIPVASGLGGGSSNAATTLWGLNQLTGAGFTDVQLAQMGAELGSDVPFFFSQGLAHCTGRGEKVVPLPSGAPRSLWIAKPAEGLCTRDVYARVVLQTVQDGANDLERAACQLLPSLAVLKSALHQLGFAEVLLSGSGSAFACFGRVEQPHLPGVAFYPAQFLTRASARGWYEAGV